MHRDSQRYQGLHFRPADNSTLLGFQRASRRDQSTLLEKVAWGTGQRWLRFEKCKFTLLLTRKIVPLTTYVHGDLTTGKAVPSTWRILSHAAGHAHMLSYFSRVRLCDPTGHSPPWDSPGKNTGVGCMPSSRGSSRPRDRTHISCISCTGRQVLYH